MKPIYYHPCSDRKLSFYKCKNWGSEGKRDICARSYNKTMGKLGFLCTHKSTSLCISREELQLTQNITRTWKKFKISPQPWKVSLYIQWTTARKFLSPHQGEDMRILRPQEAACQEQSQRCRGELYQTMEEFLNSVSEMKQTISCLLGPGRGQPSTDQRSLLLSSCKSKRGLVQVHLWAGLKYKQTLFPCLVQSQAIKQALEISNLIRKKEKKNTLGGKAKH